MFDERSFSSESFSSISWFLGDEELPVTPPVIQVLGGGGVTRISTQQQFHYDGNDDEEVIAIISEIIASGVIYELGRLPPKITFIQR